MTVAFLNVGDDNTKSSKKAKVKLSQKKIDKWERDYLNEVLDYEAY